MWRIPKDTLWGPSISARARNPAGATTTSHHSDSGVTLPDADSPRHPVSPALPVRGGYPPRPSRRLVGDGGCGSRSRDRRSREGSGRGLPTTSRIFRTSRAWRKSRALVGPAALRLTGRRAQTRPTQQRRPRMLVSRASHAWWRSRALVGPPGGRTVCCAAQADAAAQVPRNAPIFLKIFS